MILQLAGIAGALIALVNYAGILTGRIAPTGRLCASLTILGSACLIASAVSPVNYGVVGMQTVFTALAVRNLLKGRK